MNLPITQLMAEEGMFSDKPRTSDKYITWHYNGSGMYYDCDRTKNTGCPRVKKGQPCGDCKGTTNRAYALSRDVKNLKH